MKHTATPWAVFDSVLGTLVVDDSEHSIALISLGDRTRHNAAFIVQACNAHADLVAALLPISKAYPDDPGTSDLDNEQPVTITLGDVRRVWRALRMVKP